MTRLLKLLIQKTHSLPGYRAIASQTTQERAVDEQARAIVFANGISAAVANRAIIRLMQLLATKKLLSVADLEEFRNLQLGDFEAVFEEADHPEAREAVDGTRDLLDFRWQLAIRDVETPIRDLRTQVEDL